ncbi:M13 family metallopeptidase [uncultured Parasphingopyxis sp.]|uniref:M13 family metallopeptidase n=1 Tax=uncultured Parasphingopyxis sp. TaxID=1547918 RepID=UPI00260A16C2|nr:M13 family metallopeptidase [uncultured Parasphingopyxis sp.]
MTTRSILLSAAASLLAIATASPALADHHEEAASAEASADHAEIGAWGVDLDARDMSVDPGDDFYEYAGGTWMANTEMPGDRSRYGSFDILRERSEQQVHDILNDLAADPASAGPMGQKVGDFYASWMDTDAIEARGLAPAQPYLDRIAAVSDRDGLLELFGTVGYASPVGVGVLPNPADPTQWIAAAGQAGLGMPNRDYYLEEGEEYDAFRSAYRDYIVQISELAGLDDPAGRADRIIALETQLAETQWEPARQRDMQQIMNPMNRDQLAELAPQFDWTDWLAGMGFGEVGTIIAAETTAITAAGELLESVPLDTWKEYLTFHFLSDNAPYLPQAFDQANFNFFTATLRDTPEQRDRWKRGVELVNNNMGEAIGQIYVQRHYPPEAERQMTELIANLRASLHERIENSDWMDEATRTEALRKLTAFEPRIGHPEEWIDYSSLEIDRGDLLGNVMRARQFAFDLDLERLPDPVDRGLWGMNPQTVNAYYNPLLNQITFPAAILQPPFFDPNADPAVNYGAIGGVIGHEIGHGFDDQGRQFDGSGVFRDWWSEATAAQFEERSGRLGAQYDSYEPIPGVNINGSLTMGENIGDLGGLEMAYGAYRRYVAEHGEPPVIDGLTGDQRFFLAWAQVWRGLIRDNALRERLLTDPHSPGEYRTNGVVPNIDAWYEAFDVGPDDAMYIPPEERVRIW